MITNSPAVIIGAMLVASLMSPIIGIGLSSITGDVGFARRSTIALIHGAVLAILLSSLMMLVNSHLPFIVFQELPIEVLARTHPTPIDLVIALAGGLAAAYAMTRPNISAALPGVAIATALMPPLCIMGIGIALSRWDIAGIFYRQSPTVVERMLRKINIVDPTEMESKTCPPGPSGAPALSLLMWKADTSRWGLKRQGRFTGYLCHNSHQFLEKQAIE